MKRCGQWLSLLWVSATLVWIQTPAGACLAPENRCARWDQSQVQAARLVSDFTLSDLKKTDEPAGKSAHPVDPLLPTAGAGTHAPRLLKRDHRETLSARLLRPALLGLPPGRGPPDQV